MFRFSIIAIPVLLILSSCSKGYGNKLTDDAIDVYFEFKEDEKYANALGEFWKEKGLTGEHKQSIRLTKDEEYYFVQVIANDKKETSNIPFEEIKLFLELQNEIDSVVFKDANSCQIVICDGSFKPLVNINQ